jgi:hypothetical protein
VTLRVIEAPGALPAPPVMASSPEGGRYGSRLPGLGGPGQPAHAQANDHERATGKCQKGEIETGER